MVYLYEHDVNESPGHEPLQLQVVCAYLRCHISDKVFGALIVAPYNAACFLRRWVGYLIVYDKHVPAC